MPFDRIRDHLLLLPRATKRAAALCFDMALCIFAVWLAVCLRLNDWVPMSQPLWIAVLASIALALPIFITNGLYRAIFRYAGVAALLAVTRALLFYGVAYMAIFTGIGIPGVPRSIGLLQPLILLVLIGITRLGIRYWLGGAYRSLINRRLRRPVLIYGAGQSGRQLATALANSPELEVVSFLDDDPGLQHSVLNGIPIHAPADLADLVESRSVHDVLLAIPSLSRQRRREIIEKLRETKMNVRLMPDMNDIAQGRLTVSDLRELDIDDLLGRNIIDPDPVLMAQNIRGKSIMVTGAGGSIGSELCRQIIRQQPARLVLVEQNEFGLYAIHQELEAHKREHGLSLELLPFLGSVRARRRMREIIGVAKPDTIYHAAAYKHVPIVEFNTAEGIRNNVLGTRIVAEIAAEAGVANFVLISTDKAVRPTNVMGASKRLAEMMLQAIAASQTQSERRTIFSMVRFGNVLGSSGSVVPLFRQQIREGGPVTLTHAEITRYFMSIPEASQLVIQAGAMAHGGDVFVLDMGMPVKIVDLARRMIELSGRSVKDDANPDGDIEIVVTGLRPGEKLYEELLIGDNPMPTGHPKIMRAHEEFLAMDVLDQRMNEIDAALDEGDFARVRTLLIETVNGYRPDHALADLLIAQPANEQAAAADPSNAAVSAKA